MPTIVLIFAIAWFVVALLLFIFTFFGGIMGNPYMHMEEEINVEFCLTYEELEILQPVIHDHMALKNSAFTMIGNNQNLMPKQLPRRQPQHSIGGNGNGRHSLPHQANVQNG